MNKISHSDLYRLDNGCKKNKWREREKNFQFKKNLRNVIVVPENCSSKTKQENNGQVYFICFISIRVSKKKKKQNK